MVIFCTWVISYVNKSLNVNVEFCCLAEDLHLGFYYLDKLSDKLLFKNYFCFFDFANMNDRMTGLSTAFGLLYNVNLDCLVSSLFWSITLNKRLFLLFFLDTVKTYQNYRWNEFVFLVNTIIDDERRLTLDLTHNNTSSTCQK